MRALPKFAASDFASSVSNEAQADPSRWVLLLSLPVLAAASSCCHAKRMTHSVGISLGDDSRGTKRVDS